MTTFVWLWYHRFLPNFYPDRDLAKTLGFKFPISESPEWHARYRVKAALPQAHTNCVPFFRQTLQPCRDKKDLKPKCFPYSFCRFSLDLALSTGFYPTVPDEVLSALNFRQHKLLHNQQFIIHCAVSSCEFEYDSYSSYLLFSTLFLAF